MRATRTRTGTGTESGLCFHSLGQIYCIYKSTHLINNITMNFPKSHYIGGG